MPRPSMAPMDIQASCAAARPAFSISVRSGTPSRSLASSRARICWTITTFIERGPGTCRRSLEEPPQAQAVDEPRARLGGRLLRDALRPDHGGHGEAVVVRQGDVDLVEPDRRRTLGR